MRTRIGVAARTALLFLPVWAASPSLQAQETQVREAPRLKPEAFREWILPRTPPAPADNQVTPERAELGKMLFFDPRVGRDKNMACASCHNPMLGWSDGLPKGRGHHGKQLARATPPITNAAYNTIQMWDGRAKTLEDQALGPMKNPAEMNTDFEGFFRWLKGNEGYKQMFAKAYPGEPIGEDTMKKAIASFERTVVSRTSPFDRWISGDEKALSASQLRGMAIFMDRNKGQCVACHKAPNFTDNGFHNLGLAEFGSKKPDLGRFDQVPVPAMKGAFKTPGLRDVERTAPYFHDGSARTLMEVVEHYERGGVVKTNLSPEMNPLQLTPQDKEDLVAFLRALSSPQSPFVLPNLPPTQ